MKLLGRDTGELRLPMTPLDAGQRSEAAEDADELRAAVGQPGGSECATDLRSPSYGWCNRYSAFHVDIVAFKPVRICSNACEFLAPFCNSKLKFREAATDDRERFRRAHRLRSLDSISGPSGTRRHELPGTCRPHPAFAARCRRPRRGPALLAAGQHDGRRDEARRRPLLTQAWREAGLRLQAATDQHAAMTEELESLARSDPRRFTPDQIWVLIRAIKVQSQILQLYRRASRCSTPSSLDASVACRTP